jgi:hypothetical protein
VVWVRSVCKLNHKNASKIKTWPWFADKMIKIIQNILRFCTFRSPNQWLAYDRVTTAWSNDNRLLPLLCHIMGSQIYGQPETVRDEKPFDRLQFHPGVGQHLLSIWSEYISSCNSRCIDFEFLTCFHNFHFCDTKLQQLIIYSKFKSTLGQFN